MREVGEEGMASLRDLLARVEAAEGASYLLEAEIEDALGQGRQIPPPYTYSLDAALALVERLDPLWFFRVAKSLPSERPNGRFWATCGPSGEQESAWGSTPALALLASMLKALASVRGGETVSQSQPSPTPKSVGHDKQHFDGKEG